MSQFKFDKKLRTFGVIFFTLNYGEVKFVLFGRTAFIYCTVLSKLLSLLFLQFIQLALQLWSSYIVVQLQSYCNSAPGEGMSFSPVRKKKKILLLLTNLNTRFKFFLDCPIIPFIQFMNTMQPVTVLKCYTDHQDIRTNCFNKALFRHLIFTLFRF